MAVAMATGERGCTYIALLIVMAVVGIGLAITGPNHRAQQASRARAGIAVCRRGLSQRHHALLRKLARCEALPR